MVLRRGKRGQVTIMVILGLVLFFIFAFMIYARSVIIKNQANVQAAQQIQDYLSQNSVNQYVTSCLDAVSKQAVIKISMQGGVLNFDEAKENKTFIKKYDAVHNMTFNVPVVVFQNPTSDGNCQARQFPPEYPYENTSLISLDAFYYQNCGFLGTFIKNSGFFGFNNLTRLCNWNGTNRINLNGTIYSYISCSSGTYSDEGQTSVQEEMESFIEQEMPKCVNFSVIARRSSANITMDGIPEATVTFGKNGFVASIKYPFTVVLRNKKPVIKNIDFSVSKDVAFKEMYDFIFALIRNDVSKYDFDLIEDRAELGSYYRGYDAVKLRDFLIMKTSADSLIDLIVVSDNNTKIDGTPLTFQFAILNRRPALDYIHDTSTPEYDVIGIENQELTIVPKGYDPDEDNITYNYSMWKEDYNDVYSGSPECLASTSVSAMITNCMSKDFTKQPKSWSNSTLFKLTAKDASYNLTAADAGFHELKIYLKENGRQSLDDWQIVKVLVFDMPAAKINGSNFYSDIDDKFASIEDPYLLDGSNSTVGLSHVLGNSWSEFMWNDTLQFLITKSIMSSIDDMRLKIPEETNPINYANPGVANNIEIIKPLNFSIVSKHNISLTVKTSNGLENTAWLYLDVKQCLNHANPSNPSFPYNSNPNDYWDSFFADHTCCSNDLKYKDDSAECFRLESYSSKDAFTDYSQRTPLPPNNQITYDYRGISPNSAANDIFKRTFARNCSGDRGNICNGSASELRTDIVQCSDDNSYTMISTHSAGTERCSGPAFPLTETSAIQSCVNYGTGVTFEKLISEGGATGYCDNIPTCSLGKGSNQFNIFSGKFLCKAKCDVSSSVPNGRCTYADECTCSSTCAGGGSPLCNGLSWPGTGAPSSKTCSQATGGKDYFVDTCSSCGLIDVSPGLCKANGGGFSDCSADLDCNGKIPGQYYDVSLHFYCNDACKKIDCAPYAMDPSGQCYTSCTQGDDHCLNNFCFNGHCS